MNSKHYRILTVCTDKDGIVTGCGLSRPVTLESAVKRAAVPFSSEFAHASTLVHGRHRIIVSAQVFTTHLDCFDLMGKPVSSISCAHEGGASWVRP
jgi:hypothetical protein